MSYTIGSVIYTAVKPIFKIYFIMATGFLLARINILTVEVTRNLSDMIMMVILPCLTFNKIVGSISIGDLKAIGVICLSALIMYSLGAFCGAVTLAATPVPRKWRGGCIAGGIFPNVSDLPIAYIQTLDTGKIFSAADGDKGIAYVCIFLATFLFAQFNCGGFRLVEYDFGNDNDLEKTYEIVRERYEKDRDVNGAEGTPLDSTSTGSTNEPDFGFETGSTVPKIASGSTVSVQNSAQVNATNSGAGNVETVPIDSSGDRLSNRGLSETVAASTAVQMEHFPGENIPMSNVTNSAVDSDVKNTQGTPSEDPHRLLSNDTISPAYNASSVTQIAKESLKTTPSNIDNNDLSSYPTSLSSSVGDVDRGSQYVEPVNSQDIHETHRLNSHRIGPRISNLSNGTTASGASLGLTGSRTLELRTMPTQSIRNVISEYSRANNHAAIKRLNSLARIATTELGVSSTRDMRAAGSSSAFVERYHLNYLVFILQNFARPVSVALLVSLTAALIPWTKALFTHSKIVPNMPNAPDSLPPLSFIMDYTAYVGQASVPLGLLMLGTTLSRLDFSNLNRKFLVSSATLTVLKLCVMPIVGVSWASKLRSLGWLDDRMIFFVIAITYSLPSATTQFYLTATYTDPESVDSTQMDCLSVYLLMQYSVMVVSLPFVVTFVIMREI